MKTFIEYVMCVAIGVVIAYALIGWLDGCGEHYIDAAGTTHNYQCGRD